jgi:hypothetical protein
VRSSHTSLQHNLQGNNNLICIISSVAESGAGCLAVERCCESISYQSPTFTVGTVHNKITVKFRSDTEPDAGHFDAAHVYREVVKYQSAVLLWAKTNFWGFRPFFRSYLFRTLNFLFCKP